MGAPKQATQAIAGNLKTRTTQALIKTHAPHIITPQAASL